MTTTIQHHRPSRGERGLSLLEVTVALSVVVVAALGFSKAIVSSIRLSDTDRDLSVATEAVRLTMEALQDGNYRETFARFNGDPADDPAGANTAPGGTFAVAGLSRLDGAAVGQIFFPVPANQPGVLRENIADARFGTPRDLNGDSAVGGANHADDYVLLPVVVRVDWDGSAGSGHLELKTLLGNYR